ncbi:MAG: hypothetical protein NT147_12110 [Candidatus Aminicenantes bacterium]|nr:hypothetical protein [Candidatus Aminicenantes bacterium]
MKFLWPGKTKSPELRGLQDFFAARIRGFAACDIIATREARGLEEKFADKIKDLEARASRNTSTGPT